MDSITLAVCLALVLWIAPTACFYIQPEIINFADDPQSQVVLKNSSLILECTLNLDSLDNSIPLPRIKWQYNGHDSFASCNSSNMTTHQSRIVSVCTIESVSIDDTGWYRCAAVDGEADCVPPCYTTITVSGAAYVLVLDDPVGDIDLVEVESACSSVHLLPFELPYPLLANLTVNFEFFWEKDGNPASNVTGVQILPSGALFISSTHEELLGDYTCISGSGMTIKSVRIQLNESMKRPPSLQLTITSSSFFSSSLVKFSHVPKNSLELVCQHKNVCSMAPVSWLHDGAELMDEHGNKWLGQYDHIASGNYCCVTEDGLVSLSSCVVITENAEISRNSTFFLKTDTDGVTSVLLNCSSSINDEIDWLYNGNGLPTDTLDAATNAYNVVLSRVNASNAIGTYQCVLRNSSFSALNVHRILPFNLTNPPISVTITIFPPHLFGFGTHNITCSPPQYTGGLNITELKYRVFMESYDIPENDDDPECIEMAFHTCNISCKHLDVFDDGNGYRVFYVKMVDSAGETAVSQLSMGERISTHICEVYVPATPVVDFLCTENSTLFWEKTVTADEDHTFVDLVCFSGEEIIFEKHQHTHPPLLNGSISLNRSLTVGDVCSYTAYGSSTPHCTGAKTIDTCTVTAENPVVSTTLQGSQVTVAFSSTHILSLLTSLSIVSASVPRSPFLTTSFLMAMPSESSISFSHSPSSQSHLTTSTSESTNTNSFSSSVIGFQSSVPVQGRNELLYVSVASGVTLLTLVGIFIICLLLLIGRILQKKPRNDDPDIFHPEVSKPKEQSQEFDAESIVTVIEQPVNNYGTTSYKLKIDVICDEDDQEFPFTPSRNTPTMEGEDNTRQGRRNSSQSHPVASSLLLTPTSDTSSSLSCKTSAYGSGSDLSHKTSAYSSTSDSSGFSYRSDSAVDADYLGFDSYSKHTKPNNYSSSKGSHTETSEEHELSLLYPNEAKCCPTILEQGEDESVSDKQSSILTTMLPPLQQCAEHVESFTSDEEELGNHGYENMSEFHTAAHSDFLRSPEHTV